MMKTTTPISCMSPEERTGAAQAAISAILEKYHCALDPHVTFTRGQLSAGIQVLPLQVPEPPKPAAKKNRPAKN